MLKTMFSATLCAVMGAILPTPAVASSEKLTFVVYDFPPEVVNSASSPSGPFIDKLKRITTLAGVEIEWLHANMSAETTMLNSGERPFCTYMENIRPNAC